MRETRADNVQSLGLAVLLHLLLFVLVFFGLHWVRDNAEPAGGGPPVEAEMVDAGDLSSKMKDALAERIAAADAPEPVAEPTPAETLPQALEETVEQPPVQPLPEPEPQEALTKPQPTPPAPVAKPDTRDQDEARRDAINRETREREQEALRRERQIELQKQQQQKAAEEKKRLAAQQQAEADAKAKAAVDAKAKAEADAKAKRLAAQRAQQLADAKARAGSTAASNPGPASGAGQGKDGLDAWKQLVVNEIEKQWRRPDDIPKGLRCPIRIKLLPGGEVLSAEVQPSCPYSEPNQRTVEAAVKKASPLPLKGNEDLKIRDFIVNFYPSR